MKGRVLITGASTGIGEAMCHYLAKQKHDLVLVARNGERLQALAKTLSAQFGVTVTPCPMDLAVNGAALSLHEWCKSQDLTIDILINNAGVGTRGDWITTDFEDEYRLIQLNIVTLAELCKLFARDMAERKQGWILNVASIAGFQPGPWMSNYYASKAYVLSLSEGLGHELKAHGITVTALCPGPVKTPFFENAGIPEEKIFANPATMAAEAVAAAGIEGLRSGKRLVIPGFINKMIAQSGRVSPRNMQTAVSGWLNQHSI